MVSWGQTGKSSGFIYLTVEDQRSGQDRIDKDFFGPINQVVKGISGVVVKNIKIPENSFNEFRVYTSQGYYIIFTTEEEIKDQLDVLRIFLNDKKDDLSFNPQYIDLRVDGRVYYK